MHEGSKSLNTLGAFDSVEETMLYHRRLNGWLSTARTVLGILRTIVELMNLIRQ